jgi:hypothetical protein
MGHTARIIAQHVVIPHVIIRQVTHGTVEPIMRINTYVIQRVRDIVRLVSTAVLGASVIVVSSQQLAIMVIIGVQAAAVVTRITVIRITTIIIVTIVAMVLT